MMTETARRYGTSLYELASEEGASDRVLEELGQVLDLMKENPEYEKLLAERSLPKQERVGLLDQAFGTSLWPYLLNFLKILCEKGALSELKGCYTAYRTLYHQDHGIAEARVWTASQLKEDQEKALTAKLERMSGKKVKLITYVNPALIGGMRVDFEGKRYDGSAAERLKTLRKILSNTRIQ